MKIFNTLEEEAFESPPEFNSEERKRFFSLPVLFKDFQANLRTPTNQACFLVAAGYFKARRKFFARQFRLTDIEYVARQIGADPAEFRVETYSKVTYVRHQRVILKYFGCEPFDETAQVFTAGEIAPLVRVQLRPKLVLAAIIQILTRKKIEIPSYNLLADMIVAALNQHQLTLSKVIDDCLSETQRARLDALLEKEPDEETDESQWRYHLTLDRTNGPASIERDAATGVVIFETWRKDGKLDRTDGPAFIMRDAVTGTVTYEGWYKNDRLFEPPARPAAPDAAHRPSGLEPSG